MKRLTIVLSLLLLAACGPAYRGEPIYGPLVLETAQLETGQQVFYRHCHACHPGGSHGLGPGINDKPLPGFLIAFQVRHGLGAMPAFSPREISDPELEALIAYLFRLRAHN